MLLEQLTTDAMKYRKLAVKSSGDERSMYNGDAVLLTTVLAETQKRAKDDGQRDPTDDDATVVLRKFAKGLEDSLAPTTDEQKRSALKSELAKIRTYLPVSLDDAELKAAIKAVADDAGVTIEMRNLKAIMPALQTAYPGRVDGKKVMEIVKGYVA